MLRQAPNYSAESPEIAREIALLREIETVAAQSGNLGIAASGRAEVLAAGKGDLAWIALQALIRVGNQDWIAKGGTTLQQPNLTESQNIQLVRSLLAAPNVRGPIGVAQAARMKPGLVKLLDGEQQTLLFQALVSQTNSESLRNAEWLLSQGVQLNPKHLKEREISAAAWALPVIRGQLLEALWLDTTERKQYAMNQIFGPGTVAKLEAVEKEARLLIFAFRAIQEYMSQITDVAEEPTIVVSMDAKEVAQLPSYTATQWSQFENQLTHLLQRTAQAKQSGAPEIIVETVQARLKLVQELHHHYVREANIYSATIGDKTRSAAREIKNHPRYYAWGFPLSRKHKAELDQAAPERDAVIAKLVREVPSYLMEHHLTGADQGNPRRPPNRRLATRLGGNDKFFDLGGEAIDDAEGNIVSITFKGNIVTDEKLVQLQDLHELREMSIASSRVTNAGMEQIVKCSKLQTLTLMGVPITDTGLHKLRKLKNLSAVTIVGSGITAEGKDTMVRAMPQCFFDFR